MATTKPRITISLNPHVYATIKRMSQLGGQPMASIISEMLDTVHEPLMRTVAFLEAAAEAPKQVKEGLRQSFEAVERDVYSAAGHSVSQIDWLTEQLKPGGNGRGSGRAAPPRSSGFGKDSTPVPVTRGSGLSGEPLSQPSKTPRKPAKTRDSGKGGRHG